ncbi:MAG: class I mannose-6-phosphate isomerase [Planctomycetales bacterium]|nr:class I mannose-6-phosphate isomerase [Planctomycetales bacterium]
MDAYPLATRPFFRDYLWGGRKLHTMLSKPIPAEGIWAESWEIVDHAEHQSIVDNGPLAGMSLRQISAEHQEWLLGNRVDSPKSLPLLLKYLDCQQVLSVQVHPDDAYASRMAPADLGKTEAWYIVAAEPDAVLYAGLKPGTSPTMLNAAIDEGQVDDVLHKINPRAGDCIFIPAGTVHALGAGLVVAEIQQASNTTFRLFDWNRVGADGNSRPLHVEQALEVIDFSACARSVQTPTETSQAGRKHLVHCEKFVLDCIQNVSAIDLLADGCFHYLTTPTGGIELLWECLGQTRELRLEVGNSVVLPAAMPTTAVRLGPNAVLLDMYLP